MKTRLFFLALLLSACGSRAPSTKTATTFDATTHASSGSSLSAEVVASPSPSPSAAAGSSIAFESLSTGTSRIKTQDQRVIADADGFADFWLEHAGSNAFLPEVDFSTQTVLAVFAGQKSTGGYSIRITAVKLANQQLTVSYHETEPAKGKLNSQVLNAPAHIVRIDKSKAAGDFTSVKFLSE